VLPIELASELPGHDIIPVQQIGWSGLKNGELLARGASRFELMLTADQNLPYQQDLKRLPIGVVVVAARSNRIEAIRPLIPRILAALAAIEPRTLVRVGTD
jgi:hypothetical protein